MTLSDFLPPDPPPSPSPRARAQPDAVWDALLELFPAPMLTKTQRGQYNVAAKELKQLSATPSEIKARARRWPSLFPKATLTPMALVKHWHALAGLRAVAIYPPGVAAHRPARQQLSAEELESIAAARREGLAKMGEILKKGGA